MFLSFVELLYKIINFPSFPQYDNASLVLPPDLSLPGIQMNSLFGPVLSIAQYTLGVSGEVGPVVGTPSIFAVNVNSDGDLHFASADVLAASAAVLAAVAFVFASVAAVLADEASVCVVAP